MMRVSICCLALAITPADASAFLSDYTLQDMVDKAHIIVIGEITAIERTGKAYSGGRIPELKATIDIEKTIKGDTNLRNIEVYGTRLNVESPPLREGSREVFFLQIRDDRPSILNGTVGEIEILDGMVRPYFITGEEREQELNVFLNRIEGILRKNGP